MDPPHGPPNRLAPALAVLRVVLGLDFLWAFFDKLFGLGYTTPGARAWTHGGDPTRGYLSSSFGPLGGMFRAMAGNPVVDVLFMGGLLTVGLALVSGAAGRLGAWCGLAMVALMYASHPAIWLNPHGPNPVIDDHVVEAAAFVVLAFAARHDTYGLGPWWRRMTAAAPILH